jgi:hypothetical protein
LNGLAVEAEGGIELVGVAGLCGLGGDGSEICWCLSEKHKHQQQILE